MKSSYLKVLLGVSLAAVVAFQGSSITPYRPDERGDTKITCPDSLKVANGGGWMDCWTMKGEEIDSLVAAIASVEAFAWDTSRAVCQEFTREKAIAAVNGSRGGGDMWIWGWPTNFSVVGAHCGDPHTLAIRRYMDPLMRGQTVIHESLHHVEPTKSHGWIKDREICLLAKRTET